MIQGFLAADELRGTLFMVGEKDDYSVTAAGRFGTAHIHWVK